MLKVGSESSAKKRVPVCAFTHSFMISQKNVSRGGPGACEQKSQLQTSSLSPLHAHSPLSSVQTGTTTNILHSNVPRMQMRTCRQCKKKFNPFENHSTACHYHPETFTGDSLRKAEWGDNNKTENYSSGDGTAEHFWW